MKRKIPGSYLVLMMLLANCIPTSTSMERIIQNGDVQIATESFGSPDKPAVLLIAGATVSMLFWDMEFCQKLADRGLFVIRYDHRDTGKSTTYVPGTTPYSIVDLTEDAVSILDAYDIEYAHFVGLSLGGMIAQIAAIKNPKRVQTLTLMSTMPWGDSDPTIPEMDQRILDFHAKTGSVDWSKEDQVTEHLLEGATLMSGRKPFDSARSEKMIRTEFRRANNYISMYNHAAIQGGESYYNRLGEIEQKTLIIHGTDDLIIPFDHSKVLLESIKHSRLVSLEGTGHELHEQDWDEIIDGIYHQIIRNNAK